MHPRRAAVFGSLRPVRNISLEAPLSTRERERMQSQSSEPSPLLFFETVSAHHRTSAIKAAISLDVFTAIAEGKRTPNELARRCGAATRGMRILCDFLTLAGFLTKHEDSYELTQDSAVFLDSRSPMYLGGTLDFLLSTTLLDAFSDLAGAVRKGGTTLPQDGTVAPEHPVWVTFARAMAPMMAMAAQLTARLLALPPDTKMKILDVAAGPGMFGIALAKDHPGIDLVSQDWPQVLRVTKENAQRAGLENRFDTIPGDAFQVDFGDGYDVVLMANFLHHFDSQTCETLMKKAYTALLPGGRLLTVDFIPNEDRVSPPNTSAFALIMLATTARGDAYTFSELKRMLNNAGFLRNELHALAPTPQQVIISHK
jgi:ubiquinone/menaquinone biosynthesis C-methylase UbiE